MTVGRIRRALWTTLLASVVTACGPGPAGSPALAEPRAARPEPSIVTAQPGGSAAASDHAPGGPHRGEPPIDLLNLPDHAAAYPGAVVRWARTGATGEVRSRFRLLAYVPEPDIVVVAEIEGQPNREPSATGAAVRLHGCAAEDGGVVWTVERPEGFYRRQLLAGDTIYLASDAATVAVDLTTGRVKWETSVAEFLTEAERRPRFGDTEWQDHPDTVLRRFGEDRHEKWFAFEKGTGALRWHWPPGDGGASDAHGLGVIGDVFVVKHEAPVCAAADSAGCADGSGGFRTVGLDIVTGAVAWGTSTTPAPHFQGSWRQHGVFKEAHLTSLASGWEEEYQLLDGESGAQVSSMSLSGNMRVGTSNVFVVGDRLILIRVSAPAEPGGHRQPLISAFRLPTFDVDWSVPWDEEPQLWTPEESTVTYWSGNRLVRLDVDTGAVLVEVDMGRLRAVLGGRFLPGPLRTAGNSLLFHASSSLSDDDFKPGGLVLLDAATLQPWRILMGLGGWVESLETGDDAAFLETKDGRVLAVDLLSTLAAPEPATDAP